MINTFQRLSIKTKLIFVMVATTVAALLLPSGAMLIYEIILIRESAVQKLASQAQIIAVSSAAALAFDDRAAALEVLAGLKTIPDIARTTLFDESGDLFADYTSASVGTNVPVVSGAMDEMRFEKGFLVVVQPVYLRGDFVGTATLIGDLREQRSRLNIAFSIIVASLVGALLVAGLLSLRLQRLITDPVLALADVARRVTVHKDYSLRGTANHQDEIGRMVGDFNQMLADVEKRDLELRNSEERFRQLAESVREVFWMTDVEKTTILYVSPSYEEIWGRSRGTLYASARDWMQAIHPDDQSRVQGAALTKQDTGEYNEEYRIVRPDGAVRWIHDRAFPIRDAKGQVYRIAGIAEDVTVRKQLEKHILEISDREQTRFGQDLHDGLCQHLVRIGFAGNVLCDELAKQVHPQADRAKKIARLVDEAITQARRLARGLYPVKLETEGLHSAIEELAASTRAETNVRVDVHWSVPGQHPIADHTVAVHLYRITQEAVANAVKHAAPSEIVISLSHTDDHQLTLAIKDDGIGIPSKHSQGMGLHIMKYRASMINAALEVRALPGCGTVVICTFNHLEKPTTTNNTP